MYFNPCSISRKNWKDGATSFVENVLLRIEAQSVQSTTLSELVSCPLFLMITSSSYFQCIAKAVAPNPKLIIGRSLILTPQGPRDGEPPFVTLITTEGYGDPPFLFFGGQIPTPRHIPEHEVQGTFKSNEDSQLIMNVLAGIISACVILTGQN